MGTCNKIFYCKGLVGKNYINSPIKSTILDNVNEISIYSGCDNTYNTCDPAIGDPDTVAFCYNATGCYYSAKKCGNDMNPDYWTMMMFWELQFI
jgi:hypothetical protein